MAKTKKVKPAYSTLKLEMAGRVATITLDRPERLNAINDEMPGEIRAAVRAANADDRVHVIVLQGAGAALCAGYDLKHYAEGDATNRYTQGLPWDPMRDYAFMKRLAAATSRFKRYAEQYGFKAATEWRDSGRPLPEPAPGSRGDEFMTAPPEATGGARSRWSTDVTGRRSGGRKTGKR